MSITSGSFGIFGQTRRGAAKPAAKPAAGNAASSGCKGGWRGVVTLRKTLKDSLQSDEPGIRKSIDRIKHITSRDYQYFANAVVTDANPYAPKVNTKIKFSDKDNNWGEERVFDSCGSREKGHWFIIEGTDNRTTTAEASGSADSFNLTVDEASGIYHFNVGYPDAKGTYNREEHTKRSGHCQAKNNTPFDRSTNEATKVDGESVSVTGAKMDPNNPNVLQGSKTWGDDGRGEVRSFVYTATWYFTRCPGDVIVTNLRFEDMKFPNWDNWQEIVEQNGTIDGNLVKITAQVVNLSSEDKFVDVNFKETYKGDKWDGARPDMPLKSSVEDLGTSIKLGAGESRDVEVLWNSQGYSWFDDGRPRYLQRIKAEAWENFKLKDSMTKNLKLSPKPIVFVPGMWTSKNSMELYQNLLTLTHSYGWKANIGSQALAKGTITVEGQSAPTNGNKSVYDKADTLAKYVTEIQKQNNAWHVDMVAHSTGGLVARLFVHKQEVWPDGLPVVKHLLMLGTPNNGVPCAADTVKLNDAFDGFIKTAEELKPEEIARFNQFVKERKGTKFSALAGNGIPLTCASLEKGDGFVSAESAKFGIEDYALTSDSHPDLLDAKHFGDFIKPRVVTGPRGTYPIRAKTE